MFIYGMKYMWETCIIIPLVQNRVLVPDFNTDKLDFITLLKHVKPTYSFSLFIFMIFGGVWIRCKTKYYDLKTVITNFMIFVGIDYKTSFSKFPHSL